jgi:hypothetical protein
VIARRPATRPASPISLPGLRIAAAALVLAAGCATPDSRGPRQDAHHLQPTEQQAARERRLQAEWRGKSFGSLLEAMGAPRARLDIPGRDPALTWAVYYGMRDTRASCFDAFTIMAVDSEERIVDCFCR